MRNWILFLIVAMPGALLAHPAPDIPVHTSFKGDTATVTVEIDPRSFTEDPEAEPYTFNNVFRITPEEKKEKLKQQGQELVDRTIRFEFAPDKIVKPILEFTFAGIGGAPLEEDDDPVMLIGTAEIPVPENATEYQVTADESGRLSVVFKNEIAGEKVKRFNVLFPGEESYVLDISGRKG